MALTGITNKYQQKYTTPNSYGGMQISEISRDAMTNVQNTIGYEHHEIHGGNHYYIKGFTVNSIDTFTQLAVTVPNVTR